MTDLAELSDIPRSSEGPPVNKAIMNFFAEKGFLPTLIS